MDRDDAAIEAIVSEARKTRRKASRGVWTVAAIVGIAGAIGFAIVMLADASSSPTKRVAAENHGSEFTVGLAVGVVVGIAIGIAIGFGIVRQRHSSRSNP